MSHCIACVRTNADRDGRRSEWHASCFGVRMTNDRSKQPVCASVQIEAPARLHLGFVDLNGELGRRYGSLGVTLDHPVTQLSLRPARTLNVTGPAAAASRALAYAALLTERLGLPGGLDIDIRRAIPDHAGLGSGTQLALAVATGLARLYGLDLATPELATLCGRGARSGIGVGAFDTGGFLLDGGRGAAESPPPIVLRRAFPAAWRIVLVMDRAGSGMHGRREVSAFQSLPRFPSASAADLCRLVLMQILPALAEGDCATFARAVGRLQQVVGDHFAPAQAGRFASPDVTDVLRWLKSEGVCGIGQSSWGPTGFAFVPDPGTALDVQRRLRERFGATPNLGFEIVGARNHGSRIDVPAGRVDASVLRPAI